MPNTPLHDRYPQLGTAPVPIEPYISKDFYAREKEHVFKKAWIHVGRIEELPDSGNYFVKDLECIDSSIIVARAGHG